MALFAQAHAKYTRFYRWSSKRRKRPHGALAGLKALLAARREKQKMKEGALRTRGSGNTNKTQKNTWLNIQKQSERIDF